MAAAVHNVHRVIPNCGQTEIVFKLDLPVTTDRLSSSTLAPQSPLIALSGWNERLPPPSRFKRAVDADHAPRGRHPPLFVHIAFWSIPASVQPKTEVSTTKGWILVSSQQQFDQIMR